MTVKQGDMFKQQYLKWTGSLENENDYGDNN